MVKPNNQAGDLGSGKGLAAEALCLSRSDGKRPPFRLQNLRLRLWPGELTVLQGASGGGKSILLMALARLIPLESGSLSLDGEPATSCPPHEWRARVSMAQAEPVLVEGTITENLLLPWSFRVNRAAAPPDDGVIGEGMARLGLGDISTDTDVQGLSTGQVARVALLRHLLLRPEILLLDEPTANLDPEAARLVWRALEELCRETGCGVLAASHNKGRAKPDQLLRLKGGKLERG